jgi:hypothetical protein
MTMAIENQQRFGMNFDHMPYPNPPQFTNPWTSTSTQSQSQSVYAPSHSIHAGLEVDGNLLKRQPPRMNSNVSMGSYASAPMSAASADLLSPNRPGYGHDQSYANAPSPVHSNYPPQSAPYEAMGYAPAPIRSTFAIHQQQQAQDSRRLSQPSVPSNSFFDNSESAHRNPPRQNSLIDFNDRGLQNESRSFGDAIDASRGMIAMSQNTTPRNIYGPRGGVGRGSGDSYGFPPTHSSSSSISSSGTYPSYFGSVDSSVSEYSNNGSDMDSVSSRTLPRPSGLLNGGIPPAPQSMMGQFSSKVSSSTQKKHKCKVCDKRFTRPSSLQTHMYSHTGEKPFSCEVEGCGRHFSVVSNLRRHRKVHKGEGGGRSENGSEDHHSDD